MPPALPPSRSGCFLAVLLYVLACSLLFWWSGRWTWLVVAAPVAIGVVLVAVEKLLGLVLLHRARLQFESRGIRFILIYSRSPNWETHIRDRWLPRLGSAAILLNWSDRAQWKPTLEVRLFKHFVNAERNFNPAVLVLRGYKPPLVYRFYYAFRYANAGRTEYLQKLESEMLSHLPPSTGTNP